jgi:hypothetical protein
MSAGPSSAADNDRETMMTMLTTAMNRRALLGGAAALLATPALLRAQTGPIRLGTLTPLTGVGGTYGPVMRDAVAGVIDQVNACWAERSCSSRRIPRPAPRLRYARHAS